MGYHVDEAGKFAEEDRVKRESEEAASGQAAGQVPGGKSKATKTTADE